MGVIYTKTSHGLPLQRTISEGERTELLQNLYWPHHQTLSKAVMQQILQKGTALIIDAHSFPTRPLPCDIDQDPMRPDFCIGSDEYHTPKDLVCLIEQKLVTSGYSVMVNRPYSGTI